jgi:hypothetical protein
MEVALRLVSRFATIYLMRVGSFALGDIHS